MSIHVCLLILIVWVPVLIDMIAPSAVVPGKDPCICAPPSYTDMTPHRTLLSHRDRSKPSNVSRRGEQKSRRWICCSLRSRIVQHRKVLDLAARVRCAESRQTMSIPGPTYLLRPPPPLPCVPRGIRTPGSFALPAPAAAMQGVRYVRSPVHIIVLFDLDEERAKLASIAAVPF